MSLPPRSTPTRRTTQLTDMPTAAALVGNALKFLRLNAAEDAYELSAVAGAYQPLDAELTALAGLVSAADKLPYFTGLGAAALADFTAFARTLNDDADAATMRATLDLEPGVDVQAYDADLTAIAALASTDGNFIVGSPAGWVAESGATARTSLGLGTTDTPQFAREGLGVAADATDVLKILSAATANASKGLEITHSGVIGSGNTGYAAWLTKSGAGAGTNIGLRLTASGATGANYPLALENNQAAAGRNAANTAWQELLKINTSDYLEILTSLVAGPLVFESDTGRTWLADMGISATPGAGTEMSYGFLLDANEVLRVYGEANGSGALQNPRVEIWNSISALTNAPTFPARIAHLTSGTPAAGIGVGLEFYQETSADNYEVIAQIAGIMEVVTGAAEDAAIVFYAMKGGAAAAEIYRMGSGGLFYPQLTKSVLSGNLVLLASSSPVQCLDPDTVDRDVTLPTAVTRMCFTVAHIGDTNVLNVKNAAAALQTTLYPGDAATLVYEGAAWKIL